LAHTVDAVATGSCKNLEKRCTASDKSWAWNDKSWAWRPGNGAIYVYVYALRAHVQITCHSIPRSIPCSILRSMFYSLPTDSMIQTIRIKRIS